MSNSAEEFTANNYLIKRIFYYIGILSVLSVLVFINISVIDGSFELVDIFDFILFVSICAFCIWCIIYALKIIGVSKLTLTKDKIFLRRWENGLYPEKQLGGSFRIPKYVDVTINLNDIESIIISKGEYFLEIGKEKNDENILKQMHSAHPFFKSPKVPVLGIIDKKNSYYIINLNHYSLVKIKKWIELVKSRGVEVKILDNII